MKNAQKGFTLIELMVVIVIIGILSAVALPKMFGMSAKAKASEVKPTMTTFERLHTAYFMENAADAGANATETEIGWTSPVSTVLTWDAATTAGVLTATIPAATSLNGCDAADVFTNTITVTAAGVLQRQHTITEAAGTDCTTLVGSAWVDAAATNL